MCSFQRDGTAFISQTVTVDISYNLNCITDFVSQKQLQINVIQGKTSKPTSHPMLGQDGKTLDYMNLDYILFLMQFHQF